MTSSGNTSLARELGRIIRDARIRQGLRQADLSLLSGVALPTISDLENAARDTRLSSCQRVLDALGIDPEAILSGADLARTETLDNVEGYDLETSQ